MLQAKKNAVPFVGLVGALVLIVSALLWDFFRRGDFTLSGLGELGLKCFVVFVPSAMLYLGVRRYQSIQLNEEGVSVELLSFQRNASLIPRFERALLRWRDVREVSIRANVISLRGERFVVRINTFYFEDAALVLQLIERHYRPHTAQ
jgi:hypothetical protein